MRSPSGGTRWLFAAGTVVAVLVFLSSVLRVSYLAVVQNQYAGSVGEITGPREVGQTFESLRPYLSGVAFQFATYSDRPATEDVIFELRTAPDHPEILRTVRANAGQFRDHRQFLFRFAPLPDSRGKTYYAAVRSPTSRPGNAITVDYDNGDPYVKAGPSSMVLFRSGRAGPQALQRAPRPQADLAFAVLYRVPLQERLRLAAVGFLADLRRDAGRLRVLSLSALVAVLLALTIVPSALGAAVNRTRFRGARLWPYALAALFLVGFFFRLLFAERLPYTNDEGTFLYDAWTLAQGRLPGGDGVLKTPVVLGVLAAVLKFSPVPVLLAGRVLGILAGLFALFPLLYLSRSAERGQSGALPVAGVWLLAAAPAIFSVYIHAQPLQLLFGLSGLALLLHSVTRVAKSAPALRRGLLTAVLAGGCFALAFGARKSSVALALPSLLLLFAYPLRWPSRLRIILAVVLGGLLWLEWRFYGVSGVQYFLGTGAASIDPRTTASAEERQNALINGVLPIFREGLPVLFLALVGLGGFTEWILRRARPQTKGARLVWVLPLGLAWFGARFLRAHERGEHFAFGVWPFWVTGGLLLALLALWPRRPAAAGEEPPTRALLVSLLLPLVWLLGAAGAYASWIKFTANYLAEFLPALVLLAGLGAVWLRRALAGERKVVLALVAFVVFWGAYASTRSGYTFEHTGTFDRSALEEAARVLRAQTPREEPILTAAVAIPVLSGHRVLFDVAHPTHYAYGFIEPSVRNIYMAPAEVMARAVLSDIRWVVHERLTAFSYFREYPDIQQLVEGEFETVAEIENRSNPLTILRRTPQAR